MEDKDKKDSNCCLRVVRKIQAPKIEEDEVGKAKSFRLFSIARPHMRGFHSSWFCFFIAFTAWFGIQPLIPTIRKELCLSKQEVAHSGTASISATIFVRIVVGPLCDMFGPRRVMSGLLIIGAIPLGFAGFIKDGTGLIIVRLFIGILGGTFIPCQFWTSAMFNAKIVGTANALVGGWGNLGGGFTFLLMPGLFELVQIIGADKFLAWKIAVVIPAVIVLGMGILILWTSDDCPQGHWSNRKLPMEQTVQYDAHITNGDIQNDALSEKTEKGVINAAFTATEEKVPEQEKEDTLKRRGASKAEEVKISMFIPD